MHEAQGFISSTTKPKTKKGATMKSLKELSINLMQTTHEI
jgi:hypothetical protein